MSTAESSDLRAAVERTAEAVRTGNLAQLMADITPEAIAQMMQMAPAANGMSIASMPSITGYAITECPPEDDAAVYQVTFESAMGRATLAASWKQLLGQWKITAVRLVSIEPAEPAPGGDG
jgi:hypothetical protein